MSARVEDVRNTFRAMRARGTVQENGMMEIIGASFLADEPSIFGEPNADYIRREIAWYDTGIPNTGAMEPPVPALWNAAANDYGDVNSQYGYLIHNEDQYTHVLSELMDNPDSRRGTIVYTRPTMHIDATDNGMNDFVCTNAVNYFIRSDKLHCVVQMRSNDAIFGYRNDYAWQLTVLSRMADHLQIEVGNMIWQAASLHVYPRHHHLIK